MHPHHRRLLTAIRAHRRNLIHSQANDSYLSSGHRYYDVSIPDLRALAKGWLKENRAMPDGDFVAVLDSLYCSSSYDEKVLASILLSYNRAARRTIGPRELVAWLNELAGWAEIDSLCTIFSADEVLASWPRWLRLIRALARDQNLNRRRAALVFLTAPLRQSTDDRLASLAFETVEALKDHREILITKAVSWLLRSMVRHHRSAVAGYIKTNRRSLPAVAVRETTRKITTGRK